MKLKSSHLKNSLFPIFILNVFLFTGCSQKSSDYDVDFNKFYKDTRNSKINNSREMHRATLRPYSVFGIKYYPSIPKIGDKFDGIASWYGPDFHSKKTSNGETYNMYDMTAAHKTLPMNTVVRVDNLENGKSIVVRINDRGPFVKGRIIDLSNKAAHEIDMYRQGTVKARVTVLGFNGEMKNDDAPYSSISKDSVDEPEQIQALEPMDIKEDKVKSKIIPVTPVVNKTKVDTPAPVNKISRTTSLSKSSAGNFGIQIGAFSQESGAVKVQKDYQKKFNTNNVEVKRIMSNGKSLFKVFINGFSSRESAEKFRNSNALDNAVITNY